MKRFNIIFALICLVALSSCETFLDKRPTNSGESASMIKTKGDAELAINGIMEKMISSSYLGRNMFLYADAKGGDLTIESQGRGSDNLYTYGHSKTSGTYSGFWTVGYNVIMQLNNLIANIEKLQAEGSQENFSDALGQAYTYRGMIYFDLVRLYGQPYNEDKTALGVPDVTEMLDAMAQVGRATVEQNYTTILSDLAKGAELIGTAKNNGFINYYGNKALQARVYLSMDKFAEALEAAEEVIGGPYKLYEPEEWVASWTQEYGNESIFELHINDDNNLSGSSLGAYYAAQADYGSCLGYFMASDYFMERLGEDPTDVRWGVMRDDLTQDSRNSEEDRLGACYKYLGSVDKKGDNSDQNAGACNIKVIRLSEMYLVAAEAALRQSTPDKALACERLNAIRKRAPALEAATEETITLDMILDERSKELVCEGHRFWDMIRCNKTIEYNDEFPGITPIERGKTIDRTHFRTILPIFESEINANPTLETQQNPGYDGEEL